MTMTSLSSNVLAGSLLGTVDNVLQTVIPDGFTKGTYVGGKLYYKSFPNDRKPYYKAEKHCNSLGGHLATFRTDIEYNYVKGKRTTGKFPSCLLNMK